MVNVIGVAVEQFVDETRPTNFVEGVVASAPTRALPTTVWYPAVAPSEPDQPPARRALPSLRDAPPAAGGGPYPLVLLAHGTTGHSTDLEDLASVLVANGYVVASPDFPETTGGETPAAFPNVIHQPHDMTFVLDAILALNDDPSSRFHGLIDDAKVGIGGRSLGGATALLLLYNTRYGEPRIRAAMCAAALEFPVEGGAFDYDRNCALLLAHSDADPMVSYVNSVDIYAAAHAPKFLLTLKGRGHVDYFDRDDAGFDSFARTVVAFYNRYVKGDRAAAMPTSHEDGSMRIEGRAS